MVFGTASLCRYLDEFTMGDTFLTQPLIIREVRDVVVISSIVCDGHGVVGVNYI